MKRKDEELIDPFAHLHGWYQRAYNDALANDSFTVVKRGSPEFKAWLGWFQSELQWTPWFMHGQQTVTLPSQWPPRTAPRLVVRRDQP